MKLPKPVAYLHVPLETWGGRIRPVASLLRYNEPDIYGEVVNLYGENQLREALASHEAVMRHVLDVLGPQAPECCGCKAEWNEAIRALEEVLQ